MPEAQSATSVRGHKVRFLGIRMLDTMGAFLLLVLHRNANFRGGSKQLNGELGASLANDRVILIKESFAALFGNPATHLCQAR